MKRFLVALFAALLISVATAQPPTPTDYEGPPGRLRQPYAYLPLILVPARTPPPPGAPTDVRHQDGLLSWTQRSTATHACIYAYSADWLTSWPKPPQRQCAPSSPGENAREVPEDEHFFVEEWRGERWLGHYGPY